jgi:XapX domain-containing protein
MYKIMAGLVLGFLIGVGCRFFDIPVPSPPKLVGALLVVAMTLGYLATDKFLARNIHIFGERQATTVKYCGGPTGETTAPRNARLEPPKGT